MNPCSWSYVVLLVDRIYIFCGQIGPTFLFNSSNRMHHLFASPKGSLVEQGSPVLLKHQVGDEHTLAEPNRPNNSTTVFALSKPLVNNHAPLYWFDKSEMLYSVFSSGHSKHIKSLLLNPMPRSLSLGQKRLCFGAQQVQTLMMPLPFPTAARLMAPPHPVDLISSARLLLQQLLEFSNNPPARGTMVGITVPLGLLTSLPVHLQAFSFSW